MQEEFIHYIWQQRLYSPKLSTVDGEPVEVIYPGEKNFDAGPDFINARIRIDNTLWAGNVEIHIDSGDWEHHGHTKNKAYDSVILHVVTHYNIPVYRNNGTKIPTIILNFDEKIHSNYAELIDKQNDIACAESLEETDAGKLKIWQESLLIERLESKTSVIQSLFRYTNQNWEETFYIFLARSFGFKTNALPFELLAKATPLRIVTKYATRPLQLEALFFGQAGFLEEKQGDEYYTELKKEFAYLRHKHQLSGIEIHLWKFMRLRPVNFPTIRIAQFAGLLAHSNQLFSKIIEPGGLNEFIGLFSFRPNSYWNNHYTFNKMSTKTARLIGKKSLEGLLINTVIPFIFIYGKSRNKPDMCDRALDMLEKLSPEKNNITNKWVQNGIKIKNAAESQSLIQLYNEYCSRKKCLYCQLGNSFIRGH